MKTCLYRKGFTLIELLVVIAIIALLLSIVVPALSNAKHIALRVVCGSNARQAGVAVKVYANDNDNEIVPNYAVSGAQIADPPDFMPAPFNSYMVYHRNQLKPGATSSTPNPYRPFHLAVYYEQNYVSSPKIFYCPAQPNSASHYVIPYYYNFYVGQGVPSDYANSTFMGSYEWGTVIPDDARGSGSGVVRTSFNYWVYGQRKLERIRGYQPIIVDNIQDWRVVPHRKGRSLESSPQGLTALFADGHASFCNNQDIFRDEGNRPWNVAGTLPLRYDEVGDNGPGNHLDRFEEILRRMYAQ